MFDVFASCVAAVCYSWVRWGKILALGSCGFVVCVWLLVTLLSVLYVHSGDE